MKFNKYIVFIAIGFELISLILLSLWAGKWLEQKGYEDAQAICIVISFFIWIASIVFKLKRLKSD